MIEKRSLCAGLEYNMKKSISNRQKLYKRLRKNIIEFDARRTFHTSYLVMLTVGLFILLTLITFMASHALMSANRDIVRTATEQRMREDKAAIARTMSAHSQALLSSVGLINSVSITPEVWSRFVNSYQNDDAFPGLRAIGVTRQIPRWQLPMLESELTDQYGRPVTVFPASNNDEVEPVVYVERRDEKPQQSIGLDIMQVPERYSAAKQAAETNAVTLTDSVHVFSNPQLLQKETEVSLIMFAPYYRTGSDISTIEARSRNIQGHAYIIFSPQKLFSKIFENADYSETRLTIRQQDAANGDILFSSGIKAQSSRLEKTSTTMTVFNKTYELEYQFQTAGVLSPVQRYAPLFALLFGLTIAIAFPSLLHVIVRSRQNAIRLANEQEVKKAQDELLSLASHQLRTPATATKQYLGMVIQGFMGTVPKQQAGFLQKAYDSNERQLRIINDILHVAKLDAGRIVPTKHTFDITALVKGVIEDNQSELRKASIVLNRKLGRSFMLVGDQYMVRMIVENLISNAIKYTDAGGRIKVTAIRDKHQYRLSIQDSGVGIAKKDLDRLFKQFSRIENERTAKVSGSGVGLYLAQNFAKLHGGEIRVTTSEGKGSTFTLILPAKL